MKSIQLTWGNNLLVHVNMRLQHSQISIHRALHPETGFLLKGDLVHKLLPRRLVDQGSELVGNSEGVVALDCLPDQMDIGIGVRYPVLRLIQVIASSSG